MTSSSPEGWIGTLFPLNGSYDDEGVRSAARCAALLVRYLNQATRTADAVTDPGTVDQVLGSLSAAVAGLDQLLAQMDNHTTRVAGRPDAHDRLGGDPVEAARWGSHFLAEARAELKSATVALSLAGHHTSRVGLNDDDVPSIDGPDRKHEPTNGRTRDHGTPASER